MRLVSVANALARQDQSDMTFVKRENWTENEVNELPSGEHDYFDRKSGAIFDKAADRNQLYDTLAKAASAFTNSGGGHLILGATDAGMLDGVPRIFSGMTTVRDWLEQKLPQLVDYRLSDFRVHVARPRIGSGIPQGRDVIVVDFGDSALAPHQSVRDHIYYYRSAGRSLPAPHFYLELLRQRLTSPSLDFELTGIDVDGWSYEEQPMLRLEAKFLVENKGRVAAYKWALVARTLGNAPEGRADDFLFGAIPGATGRASSIRIDDTILPGCTCAETKVFGVRLRPTAVDEGAARAELSAMLLKTTVGFQLATESSPGDRKDVPLKPFIEIESIIRLLKSKGLIKAANA
jgi:hypothetical protein